MTGDSPVPDPREGQVLAHRQVLVRLIRALPPEARQEMADWLSSRVTLRDGQEDPGAVPDAALAIALGTAEEFRLIAERVRAPDI